jgi:hypothetical protein
MDPDPDSDPDPQHCIVQVVQYKKDILKCTTKYACLYSRRIDLRKGSSSVSGSAPTWYTRRGSKRSKWLIFLPAMFPASYSDCWLHKSYRLLLYNQKIFETVHFMSCKYHLISGSVVKFRFSFFCLHTVHPVYYIQTAVNLNYENSMIRDRRSADSEKHLINLVTLSLCWCQRHEGGTLIFSQTKKSHRQHLFAFNFFQMTVQMYFVESSKYSMC